MRALILMGALAVTVNALALDLRDHAAVMQAQKAGWLKVKSAAKSATDCPKDTTFFWCGGASKSTDGHDYARDQKSCPMSKVNGHKNGCVGCGGCVVLPEDDAGDPWDDECMTCAMVKGEMVLQVLHEKYLEGQSEHRCYALGPTECKCQCATDNTDFTSDNYVTSRHGKGTRPSTDFLN